MEITRRSVLGWATLLTGASLGFTGLSARRARAAEFGPLIEDPDSILDLPAGFSYRVIQRAGATMSDGRTLRGAPDGMAAFAGENGQIILMRNHELSGPNGGVSRVVLNAQTLEVLSSNDVLSGTSRNCAGGPSPWGWLSCEEEAGTGGVWVCPTGADRLLEGTARVRIDDYGSFKHEAVCIDPDTLTAYLTEDDGDSFLYRMVPTDAANNPFRGQLQAMKAVGSNGFRTDSMTVGQSIEVEWVDVVPATARASAAAGGGAVVVRGEGIWWFGGNVYFTATSNGQVFQLTPTPQGGSLKLLANTLRGPDNITVAPWGELFVAEDTSGENLIKMVDAAGNVREFARNAFESGAEIAGVCFSPDGKVLFANFQKSGHTLAITGPFPMPPDSNPAGTGGAAGSGTGGGGEAVGGSSGSGGVGGSSVGGSSSSVGGSPVAAGGSMGGPDGIGGQSTSGGSGGSAAVGAPAGGGMPTAAGNTSMPAPSAPPSGSSSGSGCAIDGSPSSGFVGALGTALLVLAFRARRGEREELPERAAEEPPGSSS